MNPFAKQLQSSPTKVFFILRTYRGKVCRPETVEISPDEVEEVMKKYEFFTMINSIPIFKCYECGGVRSL